jgi:hypothetical protein
MLGAIALGSELVLAYNIKRVMQILGNGGLIEVSLPKSRFERTDDVARGRDAAAEDVSVEPRVVPTML